MKLKHFQRILRPFIGNIFITSMVTGFTLLLAASFVSSSNLIDTIAINPMFLLFIFIILVLAISTVFTFMIYNILKNFFRPIKALIDATENVSKGDFTVFLDENHRERGIRRLNRSFNKMVRDLNSIETLRNDFIVNVSHEFKTPISAIEGYATLLQQSDLSEQERIEYSKTILESSRQLSSLSGNILKLSKLESQEITPDNNYFHLDEQLRQAILILESSWSKKDIYIDLDLPNVKYLGSEDLLMQVWINLYSNAIKFTPNYGTIYTKLIILDDSICISISDTGIGMSEDVKNRVFEKFYQGDKSRSFEGNGLGLTLVKRILDLCNCKIEVESEINMGTTFNIYLPKN